MCSDRMNPKAAFLVTQMHRSNAHAGRDRRGGGALPGGRGGEDPALPRPRLSGALPEPVPRMLQRPRCLDADRLGGEHAAGAPEGA